MKIKLSLMFAMLFTVSLAFAQEETAPDNWFLLAPEQGYHGVSIEKAYNTILKGKASETVIVAVIDSGIDAEHEDLKDVMWVNEDEIAGNGIDDDKNGYVDDIHGWNFIGGKDGKNVSVETLEATRLYAKYRKKYGDSDGTGLKKKEKAEYELYQKLKEEIETKREELEGNIALYSGIMASIEAVQKAVGKEDVTAEEVEALETEDEEMKRSIAVVGNMLSKGNALPDVKEQLGGYVDYLKNSYEYNYNPDFESRSIVGDNYADSYEKGYGNNDVEGPDASHGTHVAGIIGATRGNDVGMDGIANNVRIMSVRAVPDGDERDKDVANAIIYAVDNGASVINMSFGKGYAWDKDAVDAAVKYAAKNDVLLVHAAGNSAQNNDNTDNFPNDGYQKRGLFKPKMAKNWLEIGALSYKQGEDYAATFSNYGKANVDVFAPGVEIYSTVPNDKYARFQGTSMASPAVAGVAATLRSYYPSLSAEQVKNIIMITCDPITDKVKQPGTKAMVPFKDLAVAGGTVNAEKAIKLAEKTKGKGKKKSKSKSKA